MAKKANISAGISLDGEKEFKQAITGINTDMKVLGSEMKKVTSEFNTNANSIQALTAKDKLLSDEVDLQRKKVTELNNALNNSTEQYGENDKRTKGWKISLNEAEAKLNDLNGEVDKNKKYMDEAKTSTNGMATSIDSFGKEVKTAGDKSLKTGDIIKANLISGAVLNGLKALGSAIVDVGRKALTMAENTIESASAIADNSKKVGMSAEEYQKWTYASQQSGLEQEKLTNLMEKQQTAFTNATDGAAIQSKAYKDLDVDIKGMNSSGAFNAVIAKLAGMTDITKRNSLANDIFGKSYADLAPLLAEGAKGISNLRQQAVDLGGVMSNEAVDSADTLGDTMDSLKTMFNGVTNSIMEELMPTFQDIADWILDNKDDIKKFATDSLDAIKDSIKFITDNAGWLTPVLGTLLTAFLAFKAIEGINVALGVFNVLMAANPFGIVIIGVATLVTGLVLLIKNWDKVSDAIDRALGKKRDFNQEGNTGVSGGGAGGKSGGGAWASGAIFTKPRLFPSGDLVGEAGAEAVLPIAQLPSLLGLDRMSSAEDTARAVHDELKNFAIYLDGDRVGSFVDTRILKGAM